MITIALIFDNELFKIKTSSGLCLHFLATALKILVYHFMTTLLFDVPSIFETKVWVSSEMELDGCFDKTRAVVSLSGKSFSPFEAAQFAATRIQ